MDDEEFEFDPVKASEWLRGAEFRWARWREKPAIQYDAATGVESPAVWDHDHCPFCHENAFSERYDDFREGWLHWGPLGEPIPPKDQTGKYPVYRLDQNGEPLYDTWVCPDCFERLREHFDWVVTRRTNTELTTGWETPQPRR